MLVIFGEGDFKRLLTFQDGASPSPTSARRAVAPMPWWKERAKSMSYRLATSATTCRPRSFPELERSHFCCRLLTLGRRFGGDQMRSAA